LRRAELQKKKNCRTAKEEEEEEEKDKELWVEREKSARE
jgi:hypothetical protein